MFTLAIAVVALGCAAVSWWCALLVRRYAPYKGRWLGAVRLLAELDVELRDAEEREEALASLARTLGADAEVRAKRAKEIHAAVQRELDGARAARLAAEKRREEAGWARALSRR